MPLMKLVKDTKVIIYTADKNCQIICKNLESQGCEIIDTYYTSEKKSIQNAIHTFRNYKLKRQNVIFLVVNNVYMEALETGEKLEKEGLVRNIDFYLTLELEWRGFFDEEDVSNTVKEVHNNPVNIKIRDIKKIFFFRACSHSGKFFMCSLLDAHPNILGCNPSSLTKNVMKIVKNAMEKNTDELEDYLVIVVKNNFLNNEWRHYIFEEADSEECSWLDQFRKHVHYLIDVTRTYSEREVFLIIYWSLYYTFYGAYDSDIQPIIFLDIHDSMEALDEQLEWLSNMGFEVTLLEAIRKPYMKLGSYFKTVGKIKATNLYKILLYFGHENHSRVERQRGYQTIRYRFEDLKLYPKIILEQLCDCMGIPWNDSLLETTFCGKPSIFTNKGEVVEGFSLKPIWYPYEEYFDAFDLFRLDILFRERSKAYGYSYVLPEKYPLPDNAMVQLFRLPYKFEEYMDFKSEEEKEIFHNRMVLLAKNLMNIDEMKEEYKNLFQFGPYLKVEN